ncbi:MAG: N-acetylglucosamine kinase, partial [Candidatus Glassbacteria bacterium]
MNETERKTQLHAGIDGGATQTRCVIAGTDCIIRGMAESGPSNPLRVGVESAVREITNAVKRAAGECDIEPDKLHMACFGVAGTRDEEVRETLLCGLRESLETSRLTVETDARIAFAAAIPEGFGVISLSGTGSVTYGIDLKGNSLYADGLGPLLGDEGSAYQVGLEGLRCVARQLDGRGPATRFTETVLDALGVYDLDSLRRLASKDGLDAVTIASLAPLILSAFGEGDP